MPGRHSGGKHLYGANASPVFDYGKDVDVYQDAVTILVPEKHFVAALSSIKNSGKQRAAGTTKGAPVAINMIQDIALAASADDLICAISGDFFGAFVPEGNLSLCVDKVDTIKQIVDY